jgi:hypothetical protein
MTPGLSQVGTRQSRQGLNRFPITQEVITTTQSFSGELAVGGKIVLPQLPANSTVIRVSAVVSAVLIDAAPFTVNWPLIITDLGSSPPSVVLYGLEDRSAISPFPGFYSGWVVVEYVIGNYLIPDENIGSIPDGIPE